MGSAEGVENLREIVSGAVDGGLLVVVSAMGKTTNALERVTAEFMEGRREEALDALAASEQYHRDICVGLFGPTADGGDAIPCGAQALFGELRQLISDGTPEESQYDYWYDRIVSYGELASTTIVAEYLNASGIEARWLDIRKCFITDNRHRDANIDLPVSGKLLRGVVDRVYGNGNPNRNWNWNGFGNKNEDGNRDRCENNNGDGNGNGTDPAAAAESFTVPTGDGVKVTDQRNVNRKVIITQGFIGSTADGQTTTLGREGSDYSAAVAANILDAESLTIWKDVAGILNADPKFFRGTRLIPEMNYLDAIELAYSGAQVIHPKTIKPLHSKDIPLYVRPFLDAAQPGSLISGRTGGLTGTPVLILKKNQVLISVRPNDFSFVLEDKLPDIFELMRRYNIRMNLIQSSAVNLSLCVDESRQLEGFGKELRNHDFRVVYNAGMELLTIRGYDKRAFEKHTAGPGIYLVQKTRRIVRIVREQTPPELCPEI